jgi:5-methylcytosine-specific restriction protein B
MTYQEYEKQVFDWLYTKFKNDNTFTFSLRQKASKGSELDYFIGTEKSKYFGTTFWNIPVGYPGSATDLINLIIGGKENHFFYYIQFVQTRSPHNDQNLYALQLIQNLKPIIKSKFSQFFENKPKNKIEYFGFNSIKQYTSVLDMLNDLDEQLKILIPLVDTEIISLKSLYPTFTADRLSKEDFLSMYEKMIKRFEKHKNSELEYDKEEEVILTKEIFEKEENDTSLNKILFGPPGTGKTYALSNKYFKNFQLVNKTITKEEFESQIIVSLSWWKVIALILLDGEAKVPEIMKHPFLKYKLLVSNTNSLNQTIWGQLSSHTINESVTVNNADRTEPLFFNKREDSTWFIVENKKELIQDLIEIRNDIKNFKSKIEKVSNLKFITFHQSFSYEDFIEGIKPVITNQDSDEIKSVSYKIEKGIFYNSCNEAAKLAGFLSLKDAIENYNPKQRIEKFKSAPPYGLFIDEINRGNVSQIFGELITLIEEDKRLGKNEALEVTLPYSKEKFGVPPNLYIIGTMNTADRSVEALDAALRRRFSFEEMPPLYDLKELDYEYAGKKASKILETINKRIEKILDKDHLIGHSYFIRKEDETPEEKIPTAFYKQIIPLLQEYFFGDYGKIGMVLGKGFIRKKEWDNKDDSFADFDFESASDFDDRDVYEIINYLNSDIEYNIEIKKDNKKISIPMNFEKAIKLLMRDNID